MKTNSDTRLDWEEGRGLLDVAIYGGKIQDDFDIRALEAILREIWSRDIFQGRKKLAGIISVTDACQNDQFRAIDRLPDVDSTQEFFGLSANALRAWERSTADIVISSLKNMSSKSLGSQERRVAKRAELKILRDLKSQIDRENFNDKSSKNTINHSNNIIKQFFSDELNLVEELLAIVKDDLDNMRVEGVVTPKKWLEKWPEGSCEILNFVNFLILKYRRVSENIEISRCVDLSWLLRPRAFLAALKQFTARECGYSLEGLKLRTKWIENNEKYDWKTFVIFDGFLISGMDIQIRKDKNKNTLM